jgi:molecular chaperone DnaK (HSP70)
MSQKSLRTFSFLPLTIRLETLGGVLLVGSPWHTASNKRSDTFSTASDNQKSIELSLFFGEPFGTEQYPHWKVQTSRNSSREEVHKYWLSFR